MFASWLGKKTTSRTRSAATTPPRGVSRSAWLLAPLLFTLPLACSSSDAGDREPDASEWKAIESVETRLDAVWKPDTVVLEPSQISSSLLNPAADDGVYRFKPSPELAAKLTEGTVLLMSGVNLVRITQVETTAEEITLHTAPASLADAAEEADLEWKLQKVLPTFTPQPELRTNSAVLRPQGVASITPDGKSASFQGTVGNFTVGYQYTRAPSTLSSQLTVSYGKDAAKLKLVGTAAMNAIDVQGKVGVREGATRDFDLDLDGLDVTFELDAGIIATGAGIEALKIPLQARVPFSVGVLPMYVGLGVEVEIESQVGPQSTVFFHTKCKATGKSSLHYDGKTVSLTGNLTNVTCTAEPKNYLAPTVNFGVGVRVDLPKITLGVGLANSAVNIPAVGALEAAVEGFVSLKHETVGNVAVQREAAGPVPVITGTCLTLDASEGVFAGGAFRIAGLELKKETQLYGKLIDHKELGAGKGCAAP